MFEKASRLKLRFESTRGYLTVENLWDLSLSHLNEVAVTVNRALKAATEDSFIATQKPATTILELKLEIVKHVITVKLKEAEDARTAAYKADRKAKILALIGDKDDEALKGKSREELMKELADL
jgi:hypothetical protein